MTTETSNLDRDQLRLRAVEYYLHHRANHKRFHELRKAYRDQYPTMNPTVRAHNFLQEPYVRDAIGDEQMYGRFALLHAVMYLMESFHEVMSVVEAMHRAVEREPVAE